MAARDLISARPWVGNDSQEGGGGDGSALTVGGDHALREAVSMVALKELREDHVTREQTLELMRDWTKKSQDIKNGRLDNSFLLRFLRVKKFSVPIAQQMLLKYLHFRNVYIHLCSGLANMEPTVYELLKSGYLFALPQRDKLGRRIIFADASKLDPFKYKNSDMAKAHLLVYESLLEDEENQVLGFTHIGDLKGVCAAHLTLWSPSEFAHIVKLGEQAVPMRHKEIHLIHMPSAFKVAFDFCKGLLSEKIRDRFHMHSSLSELHQSVDPSILPKEYGGSIPIAEMIDLSLKEISRKKEVLLSLDKLKYDKIPIGCKVRSNPPKASNTMSSLPGSFRRLEVD